MLLESLETRTLMDASLSSDNLDATNAPDQDTTPAEIPTINEADQPLSVLGIDLNMIALPVIVGSGLITGISALLITEISRHENPNTGFVALATTCTGCTLNMALLLTVYNPLLDLADQTTQIFAWSAAIVTPLLPAILLITLAPLCYNIQLAPIGR
jgi:hypothetical protein